MNNMQALKTNLPEDIALLKAWGDFDKAAELISLQSLVQSGLA